MAHPEIERVTERVVRRSAARRRRYLDRIERAIEDGPGRAHFSCANLAHAVAASGRDKAPIVEGRTPNLGVVTAYNDMLSAHQPFERYPDLIREAARELGATAQVAGGVPAMCDGVTQGLPGMELSLFSRDVIALSASVALSHNCFDAAIFLGVCDKIVPGLVIAAASFGHLPAIFLPAGPMTSGLPNDEKAAVRQRYAKGEATRDELLDAEMKSYHGPGTCTFYGTANSNQMLMEVMGLHLPGASFINPGTPLREALTREGVAAALRAAEKGEGFTPTARILSEKTFVNAIVGLHATGGSTNLAMHLTAMAAAAGVVLDLEDLADLSRVTPLLARVYPNGLADVNHFAAAGGLPFLIRELLGAGLMHEDVETIAGPGLARYGREPMLEDGELVWRDAPAESGDANVLRAASAPFQPTGGLTLMDGDLGRALMKTSAVKPERQVVEAEARVFESQAEATAALNAGALDRDMVVVVRFQGPKANGMPELHRLTPALSVALDRGHKVALVTDGRMSGASGKVPAAIHVSPEAAAGGPIAKLRDGDRLRVDGVNGRIEVLTPGFLDRPAAQVDLTANQSGIGRELFENFRRVVGRAEDGASALTLEDAP